MIPVPYSTLENLLQFTKFTKLRYGTGTCLNNTGGNLTLKMDLDMFLSFDSTYTIPSYQVPINSDTQWNKIKSKRKYLKKQLCYCFENEEYTK